MKSPHKEGQGAYEDYSTNRWLPPEEERLVLQGYKFLGWQMSPDKAPEYRNCINFAHNYASAFPHAWKSVQHTPTGSDVTQWCTICRIYWKTDMSG